MDESTAVMAPQEIDELMATLRSMAAQGKSIVFISHKLHEVTKIADRLTVSVLTVKKHNRHIYHKLGVAGRRQAVAMAKTLNLIA